MQIDRYTMPKQPESTPVHVLSGRLASFRALESANVPAHAAAAGLPARTLMGPLSARQIEQFKQDGALLLPGFVGEAQLESYRDQAWAAIGYDRNDRSQCDLHGNISRDLQPPPHELPQFRALIDQLGDGAFGVYRNSAGLTGVLRCIFPGQIEPDEWELPSRAHVDGYNPSLGWRGVGAHRVCTTFYLHDFEERGGCFTYWPKGHQRIHEYLRAHPEQVDGRFTARGDEQYASGRHAYQGSGE